MSFKRGQEVAILHRERDDASGLLDVQRVTLIYRHKAKVRGMFYDATTGACIDNPTMWIEPATDAHRKEHRHQTDVRDVQRQLRSLASGRAESSVAAMSASTLNLLHEHLAAIEAIIDGGEQ